MTNESINIDVKGKMCPIPLVRLEKILKTTESGVVIRITGDDPTFEKTIIDHCNEKNLDVLDISKSSTDITITLKT